MGYGWRRFMDKRKPLIAIVDDDISVCRAIKRLVRSLDMNAETFNSGAEFTKFKKRFLRFTPIARSSTCKCRV